MGGLNATGRGSVSHPFHPLPGDSLLLASYTLPQWQVFNDWALTKRALEPQAYPFCDFLSSNK